MSTAYTLDINALQALPTSFATCSIGQTGKHPLLSKLQAIASAGFKGIELSMPDLVDYAQKHYNREGERVHERSWEELVGAARMVRVECERVGLEVRLLQPFANFEGWRRETRAEERKDAFERLEGWIRIMKAVKCEVLQVGSTDIPEEDLDRSLIIPDLQALADRLARDNLRCAYENWAWSTHAPTSMDVLRIAEAVNRPNTFGLCLDTFQESAACWADPTTSSGLDESSNLTPESLTSQFKKRLDELTQSLTKSPIQIFFLQISDAYKPKPHPLDAYDDPETGMRPRARWSNAYRPLPFSGGYLPVVSVARAVLLAGFKGVMSIEVFDQGPEGKGKEYELGEFAKEAMDKYQELLKDCMEEGGSEDIKAIGIVGAGNMGTSMALGFAELGLNVSLWDVSLSNVEHATSLASKKPSLKAEGSGSVKTFQDITDFARSLGDGPRVFLFSITHGHPADSVLDKMKHELRSGDIILDGGNEHWERTKRRQREMDKLGVKWIGMGVSGGVQSARHGPSMSPGGDRAAIDKVLPILEKFAAKDHTGRPCVAYIGPGGAGHFVKMAHNAIEQGMLSVLCEAFTILKSVCGLGNPEIGEVFKQWCSEGKDGKERKLKGSFLVDLAVDICKRPKTPHGDHQGEGVGTSGFVLDDFVDKVVQDADSTEGTGVWSVEELADKHVSGPTIAAAHFMRIASADRAQRLKVASKLGNLAKIEPLSEGDDAEYMFGEVVPKLELAVYAGFLAAFCQGLELIARASKHYDWNVNLGTCLRVWREGCIIKTPHIADLLEPVLSSNVQIMNIKLIDEVAQELSECYPSLRQTVGEAVVSWNAPVPALSASLEYIKYVASAELEPARFMEGLLDAFGAHGFDMRGRPDEDPGKVHKGHHTYTFRPI